MKRLSNLTARLMLLLCIVCIISISLNCRKLDSASIKNESVSLIGYSKAVTDETEYKTLFKNISNLSSADLQQTTSNRRVDLIRQQQINWENGTSFLRKDSSLIVSFKLEKDSVLNTLSLLKVGEAINYRNKTLAIFLKKPDGVSLSFYMTIIEDIHANGKSSIDQVDYDRIPASFNGKIIYYTFGKKFINGNSYESGKVAAKITTTISNAGILSKSGDNQIQNIAPECGTVDVFQVYCEWGGSSANPYEEFHGCTETYLYSYYLYCDGGGGGGGVGGDGSGGGPPLATDPCGNVIVNGRSISSIPIKRNPPLPGTEQPCDLATVAFLTRADICGYVDNIRTAEGYTGTIRNLGFTIIRDGLATNRIITMPTSCFMVPAYYTTPDELEGSEPLRRSEASTIFILAYNSALTKILIALRASNAPSLDAAILASFKTLVQTELYRLAPGSRFATGSCIGANVPSSYANYCATPL